MKAFALEHVPPPISRATPDVLVMILERLPDVESLKSAVLSHELFYQSFSTCKNSICTTVLEHELSEGRFTHAVVTHEIVNGDYALPKFEDVDIDNIAGFVDRVRQYRNKIEGILVSPSTAFTISRRDRMVVELADLLVDNCAYAGDQLFTPCGIQFAIDPSLPWNLSILAGFSVNLRFTHHDQRDYLLDAHDKLTEIQKCIANRLFSPWEYHQVIALSSYFRRALIGFENETHGAERHIPELLLSGVEFIHEALCVVDRENLGSFLQPFKDEIGLRNMHGFGMVLCRGVRDSWTRREPKEYESYTPFWEYDDQAYWSWHKLESRQLEHFSVDPVWLDYFQEKASILEGRLDLWSAALWDEPRWDEINRTLDDFLSDVWEGIMHHWDPMAVGFSLMVHPDLME
ncbi:hypothetical protein PT974_09388 [Cladobotryum mycophilum]|uniref:Uncharacterized protein n=1 Tax=Cladobotryum mycophilum TaxID=491253 RepID=A0ABR0SH63_9HYPO